MQRYWGAIAWEIIDNAINKYDNYMLDDDYDATTKLKEIMNEMKEQRKKYLDGEMK